MITECEEVAASIAIHMSLADYVNIKSIDDARIIVKKYMDGETYTVIDNTAEALYNIRRRQDMPMGA